MTPIECSEFAYIGKSGRTCEFMKIKLFHYWQLPVLSALVWWAMLIILLSLWASEGFPNYSFETKPDQHILYISDIGAGRFQPIFVIGSSVQGALFILSLSLELRLRLTGRLRRDFRLWAVWSLWGSLGLAVIGQSGIILVAVFDTKAYHSAHVSLLVVYIVFVGVSALLNVLATAALEHSSTSRRHIKIALWFKIFWLCIEFILAIAFICSQATYKNVPAVLEWTISFIYPLYELIIAWDLWPALGKAKNHYPRYNESHQDNRSDIERSCNDGGSDMKPVDETCESYFSYPGCGYGPQVDSETERTSFPR